MIEMKVLGLTLDGSTKAPILVLRAEQGDSVLPLWIGGVEALSISLALSNTAAERPLTHDLMVQMLRQVGASLVGVSITDVRDGVFFAELDIVHGERLLQIDCRPSDAVALALRVQAPIRATAAVLAQAPRERYFLAVAGQPPLPDETGEIVRRSLRQAEQMLAASCNAPAAKEMSAKDMSGKDASAKGAPVDEGRERGARHAAAPAATDGKREAEPPQASLDDDTFAKLLRELEPASKNRM